MLLKNALRMFFTICAGSDMKAISSPFTWKVFLIEVGPFAGPPRTSVEHAFYTF